MSMSGSLGKIFIDPGHGGSDPGAVHPSGQPREIDFTLPAALHLAADLRVREYDSVLTPAIELQPGQRLRAPARARWCNEHASNGRDLVISIHCNASESHRAIGSEVWYYSQSALAIDLSAAIALHEPARNRGAKRSDGLAILTQTTMPAVLLELGFVDAEPGWLNRYWVAQMEAIVPVIESWMAL